MKIQSKENVKAWQEVHDQTQELVKFMKDVYEKEMDLQAYDNLDLEIES